MATESFFSNASLAYLASAGAGKDGKAYSIKPTDGTGDFTFSRGSNLAATRVGADGLIEKGRENLLLRSNTFNTSPWFVTGIDTPTSGQSGYDGLSDAWILEKNGAFAYLYQDKSISGVQTFSFYGKAGTLPQVRITINTSVVNVTAAFDLANGIDLGSSQNITSSIESVGNGWYRCSVTYNQGTTSRFRIYPADVGGDLSGTSGNIYIQDAQVELGLVATDYIESGASTGKAGLLEDEPRFDYSGGATCPSLLLEPSRTNLVTQSEYFGGSDWTNSGTSVVSGFTSPEGLSNAYKLVEDSANLTHFINSSEITTPDTTYSSSVYIKANGRNKVAFRENSFTGNYASFNLSDGTLIETNGVSASIESASNGWYRINYQVTSGNNYIVGIYLLSDSYTSGDPFSNSYQGDGTSGAYIYGAQLESGSYPTSYIPNHSGGSVTRGADDSLSNTNFSSIFGASSLTQYTIFLEVLKAVDSGTSTTLINKGTNDQGRVNYLGGDRLVYYSTATGYTTGNNITDGNPHKYLLSADNGTIKQFFDGVLIDTNTNALDELTNINIGGDDKNLNISQFLIFPEALSDADCITLTTL